METPLVNQHPQPKKSKWMTFGAGILLGLTVGGVVYVATTETTPFASTMDLIASVATKAPVNGWCSQDHNNPGKYGSPANMCKDKSCKASGKSSDDSDFSKDYVCPQDAPKCVGYVGGKHWGKCVTTKLCHCGNGGWCKDNGGVCKNSGANDGKACYLPEEAKSACQPVDCCPGGGWCDHGEGVCKKGDNADQICTAESQAGDPCPKPSTDWPTHCPIPNDCGCRHGTRPSLGWYTYTGCGAEIQSSGCKDCKHCCVSEPGFRVKAM